MARNKELQPTSASFEFLYHSVHDVSWDSVEKVARKPFDRQERQEIFECTDRYSWESEWLRQAPPEKEVRTLADELLKHCQVIIDLAAKNHLDGVQSGCAGVSQALTALSLTFGKNHEIIEDLRTAVVSAERIVTALTSEPNFAVSTTAKSVDVSGLVAFIDAVIEKAAALPARNKQGEELVRWGISVGPQSEVFRLFSCELLKRAISKNQLREAWEEARNRQRSGIQGNSLPQKN